MRFDQIQYNGEDLSAARSAILGFPVAQNETVKTIIVRVDTAVSSDAVFNLQKNGVDLFDDELTIPNGEKRIKITSLNIALSEDDVLTLDFVSGSVSSPVTLGLGFDEASGGGSLPPGDLKASTNVLEMIQGFDVDLSNPTGKNGFALKFDEVAGKLVLASALANPRAANVLADFNDGTSGELVNSNTGTNHATRIADGVLKGSGGNGASYDSYVSQKHDLTAKAIELTLVQLPTADAAQVYSYVNFADGKYCRMFASGTTIVCNDVLDNDIQYVYPTPQSDGLKIRIRHETSDGKLKFEICAAGSDTWTTIFSSRVLATYGKEISDVTFSLVAGNYSGSPCNFQADNFRIVDLTQEDDAASAGDIDPVSYYIRSLQGIPVEVHSITPGVAGTWWLNPAYPRWEFISLADFKTKLAAI